MDKSTDLHTLANNAPGGKSLWTDDLEEELIQGRVDLIVHSLKDVPTKLRDGVRVVAVGQRDRETAGDCVVLPLQKYLVEQAEQSMKGEPGRVDVLASLPRGSIVGTSSIRRAAMVRRAYPHLVVRSVRGNVPTRLRKLDASVPPAADPPAPALTADRAEIGAGTGTDKEHPQHYDALILATAGLQRLGLAHRIACPLTLRLTTTDPPSDSSSSSANQRAPILRAVGQGAIGVEWRSSDTWVTSLVEALCDTTPPNDPNDPNTVTNVDNKPKASGSGWRLRWECTAERRMLAELEGGCSVPVGVECEWTTSPPSTASSPLPTLHLSAVVISPDGHQCVSTSLARQVSSDAEAESLGEEVAAALIAQGAGEILKEIRNI